MNQVKIIMVEDNHDLLANTVEYLTLEGFSIKGVSTALDFFQALTVEIFDIAIIDIGLPDRSGLEVAKHLRQHTDLGIILLTARDSIEDKMSGYDSGADLYFVKPVDLRELTASLKNLLCRIQQKNKVIEEKSVWNIDKLNRELISPSGVRIKLTIKEFTFIELLIFANGTTVERKSILRSMNYDDDGPYGNRALDIVVVRLRNKIKKCTQEDIPIITERSLGFRFKASSSE